MSAPRRITGNPEVDTQIRDFARAVVGMLVKCASCREMWKPEMLDDCLCGRAGICPPCMAKHWCRGGLA